MNSFLNHPATQEMGIEEVQTPSVLIKNLKQNKL